jgi:hypothetical protein
MPHGIILLVDIYWRDLVFMKRYMMGSCIYDKISWISRPKCQLFIGQEIYEGSFIFHVIYFNFILSFLLKNKITYGEIWLVENLCFYTHIFEFDKYVIIWIEEIEWTCCLNIIKEIVDDLSRSLIWQKKNYQSIVIWIISVIQLQI